MTFKRRWVILFPALVVLGLASCKRDKPTEQPIEPQPSGPPIIDMFAVPQVIAANSVTPIGLRFYRGGAPITQICYDFDGDGVVDSTVGVFPLQMWANMTHVFARTGEYTVRAVVWDQLEQSDTASARTTVIPYVFESQIAPDSGVAPLHVTIMLRHEIPALFDSIRIRLSGRTSWDTVFAPAVYRTTIPLTCRAGAYQLTVEAHLPDTVLVRTTTLTSVNTSPQGSLNWIEGFEDSTLTSVRLATHFWDLQTAASDLEYEIVSQSGPATAAVEGDSLKFALHAREFGDGTVELRVTDADGGSLLTHQDYTVRETVPLMLHVIDLETGNDIREGFITANQRRYSFTVDRPLLHVLILPSDSSEVSGFWAVNCETVGSFERTLYVPGRQESSVSIPVVCFDSLNEAGVSAAQFQDMCYEARGIMLEADWGWYLALGGIDFSKAAAGFENGGYTIYIEKQSLTLGEPQDSLSDAEQEQIENTIRGEILANIPMILQPQIRRAALNEPTYNQGIAGPTHEGLILVAKRGAALRDSAYNDYRNGQITRAIATVDAEFSPRSIIQGVLRALVAPGGKVREAVNADKTILHESTTANSMTTADRKLLNMAVRTKPGIWAEHILRVPT
jgi:hypothetical protein